jgi:flagellar hook assembly protein FlgD
LWWIAQYLDLPIGIAEQPGSHNASAFGFAPRMSTLANDHVSITYTTTVQGHVSLQVYDGVGRLVQTLVNTQQPAGEKSFVWNRRDMNGRTVANGVYFFKLQAENQTATQKLVLVD